MKGKQTNIALCGYLNSTFSLHIHAFTSKIIFSLTRHSLRYVPSQADVTVYKAVTQAPDPEKHPHVARWYKHITSYANSFETIPGDASLPASAYGPETAAATENPAQAPAAEEEEEEVDLFGSDDEEEDAAKAELTKKRLEEYAAKKVNPHNIILCFQTDFSKASKPKPAAKSLVTLEVKPWVGVPPSVYLQGD